MLPASSHSSAVVASHTCTVYSAIHQLKRCIKYFAAAASFFICIHTAIAQKVAPVSKSPLTGIALPNGSKQDKRLLMTTAADITIADAAKKNNVKVKSAEVIYTSSNFTADSLTSGAQQAGWAVMPDNGSKNFYWLQQGGKNILAYFYPGKKENSIYFAESNQPPAGVNSTPTDNTQIQNNKPASEPVNTTPPQEPPQEKPAEQNNIITPAVSTGYKFSTTNFDDGWTATEQADWVEVTKGNIKVLLHYPKDGTVFPADPEPLTNAAWNILVAPRYSSLRNYKTAYITTYNRPYLGMGYATEKNSGNEMFVLLFRQGGGWIEFVTPDKNTFIQQYKFDPETIRWDSETDLLKPLGNMASYNRFAVAATDLQGKYTDRFASNTFYTNIYTGMSAGMSTYSSSQFFEFGAGQTYKWQLVAANSYGGRTSVSSAKGAGSFTMLSNWKMEFSDIEGKPCRYDVYFSAIKGGRVLWMNNADVPGSGIFTGFSPDK